MSGPFRLYGYSLYCDADLAPWLCAGEGAGGAVRLAADRAPGERAPLPVRSPLFSNHGRTVSLSSDRAGYAPGQPWCFAVDGVVEFRWRAGADAVAYRCERGVLPAQFAFWAVHLFVPVYLTLERGCDFLHAGAVEVDGRAILLTAPTLGGKSTLTQYFTERGHGLVADDKVAARKAQGGYRAAPSHPHCRPYRAPEDLGRRVDCLVAGELPLGALYALRRVAPDEPVRVAALNGVRAFELLAPNYLFSFRHLVPERLAFLGELLGAVPAFEVTVPADLQRLDEVYGALCERERAARA